jgi:ribonuclease E
MPNKMLIDATHPEETRVVVLRGNRVEEFDFESANRKQLRGNIYLAKVTRVEPSLQAAFIEYGGNRHGFLAFSEIHPDYYQIPVADRQALIEEEERAQKAADADADHRARGGRGRGGRHRHRGAGRHRDVRRSEPIADQAQSPDEAAPEAAADPANEALHDVSLGEQPNDVASEAQAAPPQDSDATDEAREAYESPVGDVELPPEHAADEAEADAAEHAEGDDDAEAADEAVADASEPGEQIALADEAAPAQPAENGNGEDAAEEEAVESVGGADALEEAQERAPRFRRQYKIQEVIKRRQVMLVQVVKEERGSKGAALTTYLSLAGRYSVLMPNTARGGGISRKITSAEDRGRLKEIAQELQVPEGMGVILRTAGASRSIEEVRRDFEYLLRLWETVRDLTLQSTAPKLVYEEGSLTRRSLRDLYNKDIDEIVVSGEAAYKDAKEFMRMLMPGHARHVKQYRDTQPIFTRYGVESQLDAMFSPIVQLRSGGYIVINQAEALVAIDVNSGRATREHHIEDTALKTNIEAAEEVARQLRLRDLAGLIVIDFIDMDEGRNNRTVERRLKDALKHDRARIQVGRISHFGLMEMSRQRIRTSVLESTTEKCPVCGGSGHVRSVSSVALQLLRGIEEMLIKGATHNLTVRTRAEVALYVLNHKRAHLRSLEERFRITITVSADPAVNGQQSFVIERGEQVHTPDAARAIAAAQPELTAPVEEQEDEIADEEETDADFAAEAGGEPDAMDMEPADAAAEQPQSGGYRHENGGGEREGGPRRRRRRGGRGRGRGGEPREPRFAHDAGNGQDGHQESHPEGQDADPNGGAQDNAGGETQGQNAATSEPGRDGGRRRRRGRRGGRRNRHGRNGDAPRSRIDGAIEEAPGAEPALRSAVEDLDRPPAPFADERPPMEQLSPAFEPPPAPPTAAAAETETPRRRSTIRESFGTPSAPAATPAAAPVISSTGSEETATPKRGWWGRKLLGDKN